MLDATETYVGDVPGNGGCVEFVPHVAVDIGARVLLLHGGEELGHAVAPVATPGPGGIIEHGAADNVLGEGTHSGGRTGKQAFNLLYMRCTTIYTHHPTFVEQQTRMRDDAAGHSSTTMQQTKSPHASGQPCTQITAPHATFFLCKHPTLPKSFPLHKRRFKSTRTSPSMHRRDFFTVTRATQRPKRPSFTQLSAIAIT
jgi:hypothetical protein